MENFVKPLLYTVNSVLNTNILHIYNISVDDKIHNLRYKCENK